MRVLWLYEWKKRGGLPFLCRGNGPTMAALKWWLGEVSGGLIPLLPSGPSPVLVLKYVFKMLKC